MPALLQLGVPLEDGADPLVGGHGHGRSVDHQIVGVGGGGHWIEVCREGRQAGHAHVRQVGVLAQDDVAVARLPDGAAHATVERVDRAAVELGERGGDGVTERAVQLWVVEALELGSLSQPR